MPVIYNGTFIGRGPAFSEKCATFDRNAGGIVANSIFINQNLGIFIEFVEGSESSYSQFLEDDLQLVNNIFNDLGTNDPDSVFRVDAATWIDISQQQEVLSKAFIDEGNVISDPGVYAYDQYYTLLPSGNVYDNLAPIPGPWFDETIYKGAFYTYLWISGWTLLYESGLVP